MNRKIFRAAHAQDHGKAVVKMLSTCGEWVSARPSEDGKTMHAEVKSSTALKLCLARGWSLAPGETMPESRPATKLIHKSKAARDKNAKRRAARAAKRAAPERPEQPTGAGPIRVFHLIGEGGERSEYSSDLFRKGDRFTITGSHKDDPEDGTQIYVATSDGYTHPDTGAPTVMAMTEEKFIKAQAAKDVSKAARIASAEAGEQADAERAALAEPVDDTPVVESDDDAGDSSSSEEE